MSRTDDSYLKQLEVRYRKACKTEEGRIRDESVAATGYHRRYAIRLLRHGAAPIPTSRRRLNLVYSQEVKQALTQVWEICDHLCSRRSSELAVHGSLRCKLAQDGQ